jgi:hypothetical protein
MIQAKKSDPEGSRKGPSERLTVRGAKHVNNKQIQQIQKTKIKGNLWGSESPFRPLTTGALRKPRSAQQRQHALWQLIGLRHHRRACLLQDL